MEDQIKIANFDVIKDRYKVALRENNRLITIKSKKTPKKKIIEHFKQVIVERIVILGEKYAAVQVKVNLKY